MKQLSLHHILMEGIEDLIFVMRVEDNATFVYEFINRAAENFTERTQDDIGKPLHSVYTGERLNFLQVQYENVLFTEKTVIYDDYSLSPTGIIHYYRTTLTPFFKNEKITHIVAVIKDVTKEKWAESELVQSTNYLQESKEKYQSLFQFNLDAIVSLNTDGYIVDGNLAAEQITGFPLEELKNLHYLEVAHPIYKEKTIELFENAVQGEPGEGEVMSFNREGKLIYLMVKFSPIVINERVTGVFGLFNDISSRVEAIQQLKESEKKFRIIAENAHELITLSNREGKIIYASPSYKEILGYAESEFLFKPFTYNIHPDDIEKVKEWYNQSIHLEESFSFQFRQKHRGNGWIWCETIATPVLDEEGTFMYIVALTRDISLQKEIETKLKHIASHDPLTNLSNRRNINKIFDQAISTLPEGKYIAVMMMDLDNFKQINDKHGHDIGDRTIQEFGKRIKECVGEKGSVARLDGDEFVVILPKIEEIAEAVEVAEYIKREMNKRWVFDTETLQLTTSIGITIGGKDTTRHALFKEADLAMYQAKGEGKNTHKVFTKK